MSASGDRKALHLNASVARMRLDGRALRVSHAERADQLIPLRRVGRAVVENADEALLRACLAIVRQGGTVHFQDKSGNICAVLNYPWSDGAPWARELAELVEHQSGAGPFHRWRDVQRRHAWSLVFRRNFQGDFGSNRARLMRYLRFFQPGVPAESETKWLEQQLRAWVQAEVHSNGLQPVVLALAGKGCDLLAALSDCMVVPLLWAYVRWRRLQPVELDRRDLLQLFELQAVAPLKDQMQRHLQALAAEYHGAMRLSEADDFLAEDA